MKIPKDKSKDQFIIEDMPDIFIQEWPGKRYVSVGMENMSFPGSLRPEFCLEVEYNEEIFVPNVYDMLLIQNFWDNLEMESSRICLRPKGYLSKKNLLNLDKNNKENINENSENKNDLLPIKEIEEIKDNNIVNEEEKKEENNVGPRRDSKSSGSKKKFNLTKSIFGKK